MFGSATQRQAEFTAFVRSAERYLTRTAYLLCGDAETARELVQEALVRTYASWWKVRADDARAYARRVLINLDIDRRRRSAQAPLGFDPVPNPDGMQRVDDRDQIARLLAELPAQQRRVIVLRYFNELSESEVAAALGISVGAVKSSCSRGLAKLRADAPQLEGELR